MSNINPQSIDGTYPIAGQDNNSQGFRDNFTNAVNNFTFAAAELTDLQNNAVLKAALGSVGQTGTPTNDLNYAYLTHAQLKGTVETKNSIGNVITGSFNVDWATGHFQTVELVGTSASLTFPATWPATNLYTKLRLQVNTYANVCALTLPAAVSTNISSIQGASGQVVTLPAGEVYVFEFTTWNNGATIAIQDVLRNYDITANGASTTFTTVTAGRVNSGFVGNVGTVITGAAISANSLNVTGNVSANNINAYSLTGIISTASQTNITAVGTLGSLNVTGNVLAADFIGTSLNVTNQANAASFVPTSSTVPTNGLFLSAANSLGFATNSVEKWVINASGSLNPVANVSYDIGSSAVWVRDVSIGRNAEIRGTLATGGAKVDTGYQIYKPTGNVSIQANVDVSRVIVAATPSGGISDFYVAVTLPNVAVDGKLLSITSNTAVASFRVLTPWVGYTVDSGANVALTAGSTVNYLFHSIDNKWFKV
jgi:hypothetical protein